MILEVTGSTVCGSDLHLMHGSVVQMEKGDILGHEFMGKVLEMGPAVKGLQKGQRVVASFQIVCGEVRTPSPHWKNLPNSNSVIIVRRSCHLNARRPIPTPWKMEWQVLN